MNTLDSTRLREVLNYNPTTGEFRWKTTKGRRKTGAIAGCIKNGYVDIGVFGRTYRAHRLAWLYVTGAWPLGELDHIDGVKNNNAFSNLRDVDRTTNQRNQKRPHKTNRSTGVLGVTRLPHGRYQARVWHEGKLLSLGVHATAEEAGAAYKAFKIRRGDQYV